MGPCASGGQPLQLREETEALVGPHNPMGAGFPCEPSPRDVAHAHAAPVDALLARFLP